MFIFLHKKALLLKTALAFLFSVIFLIAVLFYIRNSSFFLKPNLQASDLQKDSISFNKNSETRENEDLDEIFLQKSNDFSKNSEVTSSFFNEVFPDQNKIAETASIIKQQDLKEFSENIEGNSSLKKINPPHEKPASTALISTDNSNKYHHETIVQNYPNQKFYYSLGFSPLIFCGNNFVTAYFQKNQLFCAPDFKLGFINKTDKLIYGFNLQGIISQLTYNQKDYFFQKDLALSSLFFSALVDFSILHHLFSPSNLIDYHLGFGITGFANNLCNLANQNNKKISLNFSAITGFSFRHFFNNHFFAGLNLDINYVFGSNKMLYFQPSVVSGIYF